MDHNLGIASGPGVGNIGLPFTLIVGETPPVVTTPTLLPAGARAKYTPLGNTYSAWAAGQPITGITAYATPGSVTAAIYKAGCFNVDAINWPAGTTMAQVQAASLGTNFEFRRLLYSDKPTGGENTLVGPGREAGPPPAVQLPLTPASCLADRRNPQRGHWCHVRQRNRRHVQLHHPGPRLAGSARPVLLHPGHHLILNS